MLPGICNAQNESNGIDISLYFTTRRWHTLGAAALQEWWGFDFLPIRRRERERLVSTGELQNAKSLPKQQ